MSGPWMRRSAWPTIGKQHVAHAEQVPPPLMIEDGARVDAARHLERDARGEVRFDEVRDHIHRRPLRRQDEVDAGGAGLLAMRATLTSTSLAAATIMRSANLPTRTMMPAACSVPVRHVVVGVAEHVGVCSCSMSQLLFDLFARSCRRVAHAGLGDKLVAAFPSPSDRQRSARLAFFGSVTTGGAGAGMPS